MYQKRERVQGTYSREGQGQRKRSANCKRRDVFKHAFKTILCGREIVGFGMVEATFGSDEPAATAPAAVDLEQELSDLIDEDEGLLIVSYGIMASHVGRQVFFVDVFFRDEGRQRQPLRVRRLAHRSGRRGRAAGRPVGALRHGRLAAEDRGLHRRPEGWRGADLPPEQLFLSFFLQA